ncbi:MAG: hypothetical protein ACRDTM_09675 [Micromonosporaceae bacterium]
MLTRIRPDYPRNERVFPEGVICRCVFGDRPTATWTADTWAASQPVRVGRERVKLQVVDNEKDELSDLGSAALASVDAGTGG